MKTGLKLLLSRRPVKKIKRSGLKLTMASSALCISRPQRSWRLKVISDLAAEARARLWIIYALSQLMNVLSSGIGKDSEKDLPSSISSSASCVGGSEYRSSASPRHSCLVLTAIVLKYINP